MKVFAEDMTIFCTVCGTFPWLQPARGGRPSFRTALAIRSEQEELVVCGARKCQSVSMNVSVEDLEIHCALCGHVQNPAGVPDPPASAPAFKAAPMPPPGPPPCYVAKFMGRGMCMSMMQTRSMPDLHGIKSRAQLERYWTRMFELEEADRHIEACRDPMCHCCC